MKIYVDADACPVKKEIERVATRNKIDVFLVSNGGLRPIFHPFVKNIFVSSNADAADKWIVDNGHLNDLVITDKYEELFEFVYLNCFSNFKSMSDEEIKEQYEWRYGEEA